jgi:hypothetical protein
MHFFSLLNPITLSNFNFIKLVANFLSSTILFMFIITIIIVIIFLIYLKLKVYFAFIPIVLHNHLNNKLLFIQIKIFNLFSNYHLTSFYIMRRYRVII